jgi:hypothetical protein
MKKILLNTALSLLFVTARIALGQSATGQITGTVTDSSGAIIANAPITLTSQLTGQTRTTKTSESGSYSFPLLPVSVYSIAVDQKGFRAEKRSDINLNVDQVVRIDVSLQVGNVTESVDVKASSVTIDTETAEISQVVSQKQVTELPLNGRNFLQLLFVGGGAVQTDGEQGSMRQGAGSAISINGARPTSNNYLLDGTSNTDTALGTPAAILSVDAIQEFKEQTATYSAEYGFSANQVNIITKSGTNELHGAVFWFLRNDALDANDYGNNLVGQGKSKLRQNQPGFVAGGPVYIPKLYNGKNKTFWLANYEGVRITRGFNDLLTIPTTAQLSGHFTSTIIDPVTGKPFDNNTIPQNRYSRLATLAVAKFFPAPNFSGNGGNYVRSRSLPNNQNQYTLRGDQQLGKFGTVFGRFTNTDYVNTTVQNLTPLGDIFFVQKTRNWQISHTVPISASLVNSFRIGYVEATAIQNGPAAPQSDVDALKLTGVFTNLADNQRTYPGIGFGGVGAGLTGSGSAVNDFQSSNQPMWDLSNSTTWIRGKHTLAFGFNYRQWQLNRDLANDFLGQFTFSGFFTGNATRDNAVADMLLGYFSGASSFQPAGFSVGNLAGNPRQFNFKYLAPYVQDDWKITSRLTLDLGTRWDYRTLPYETNNRFGWRDLSNPKGGLLVADQTLVTKGIVGDSSYYKYAGRRNPMDASKKVFAPRIGFAYRPFSGDKTVIRSGYGVFFDSAEGREIDGGADIFPYVSRGSYNQSLGQTNLLTTDQMFPSFANASVATPAANSFLAVSQSPLPRNPYVQQWSFSIQHQLTKATTLETSYIGNKGTHLLMRRNIAQALLPKNPAFCAASAANAALSDCPVAARKPFPNFGVYIDSDWSGNSSYNAFNAKIEHRTGSVILTSVYTWAKSIDSKSAAAGIGNDVAGWQGFLDNNNIRRDRGRSEFDVDHRLVTSFVYQLPFGHGAKYLSSANKAVDAVVGGWQVNGIVTFQHGFPMTISAADVGGLNDTFGTNRADIVGVVSPSGFTQNAQHWFNTAAFKQPAAGFLGNSGRGILRLPGLNNWDVGFFKNFRFAEKASLQFRVETFNTWNHTQYNAPVRSVADPNFGQIFTARPARENQLGLKFLW